MLLSADPLTAHLADAGGTLPGLDALHRDAALADLNRAPALADPSVATSVPLDLDGFRPPDGGQDSVSREVVFVNGDLPDHEQLAVDLLAERADRRIDVVILDAGRDGVRQVSEALARYQNLDAVHFVTHGSDGTVELGNTVLQTKNLASYQESIQSWAGALGDDADLLFYGCNLAAGEEGRAFIQSLADLTGSDIAASDNLTGQAAANGDWALEHSLGTVETATVFSAAAQDNWHHTLAFISVTTNTDTVDGGDTSSLDSLIATPGASGISLREAVIAANNTNGADTILLGADTYTLAISGGGEDDSGTGDLDIRDTLTITGVDASLTTISGAPSDRVFHVQSGETLTMTDVTVGDGRQDKGGGLYMAGSSTLTLERVVFANNTAIGNGEGGAIYNDGGTLTLRDSTLQNNSATGALGKGGGLYNDGAATLQRVTISNNDAVFGGGIYNKVDGLTLDNVTISGNNAQTDGGGIWTDAKLDATHVTLVLNIADDDSNASGNGAGIWATTGNDVTLQNSILGANTLGPGGNENFFSLDSNPVTSLGGNIDDDGTAGLSQPSDTNGPGGVDLQLGALADNGGFTNTHDLGGGSTAIDHGVGAPLSADQRGVTRDGSPDAGAYESSTAKIAPAVSVGGTATYTEAATPVRIDPTAALTDPDTANFNGGLLTVDFVANGTADDRLSVQDQGAGTGRITTDGSDNVYFDFGAGAVLIGAFTGGTNHLDPLLVNFNSNATRVAVQALMRAVTFETVATPAAATTRTLSFTLDDGDAGAGNTDTADVQVVAVGAVNDAPVLSQPAQVFINEFHYDNVGVDAGEMVEVAGVAGTDLTGWSLVFYNGLDGLSYRTEALSGTLPDQGGGFGTVTVNLPLDGIQNGDTAADGIALVDDSGKVLEFISYEGVLTAGNGPAAGMNSTDIGVAEDGTTPVGQSLQMTGAGQTFTWTAASANTSGAVNTGQDFTAAEAALTEQVAEGASLVFSAGGGNAISVADSDAGAADPLRITLTVSQGTLTLGSTAGLSGLVGNGTATVTFDGTVAEVNTALEGLSYQPVGDYFGADLLTIEVDDQGNTGSGGALTDIGQVQITVTPVNDGPAATITPVSYAVSENTTYNLHANGLSIADVDAGGASVIVTLSVGEGTLTVAKGSNTLTVGGSPGAAVTLTGALSEIQALLDGLNGASIGYDAIDLPSASTTLTLDIDDQGNTGGGALTAQDTAVLNITTENDGPGATITPVSYAVSEHTTYNLHANGLSIADVDAGGASVIVTLSVGEGTLTVAKGSNTLTVGGSPGAAVTLTGALSEIQALLDGLNGASIGYDAIDLPSASTTLTLDIDDQGNTGGGALTAQDTAVLNITTENDGPGATITPVSYAVSENTTYNLHANGLSIADVDAGGANVLVTLSVGEGTLTVAKGGNTLTVGGSPGGTVTLTGALSEIQALLDGLNGASIGYDAIVLPSASTTLTLDIDDQGNTGGGALTAQDTATLNILPDNDTPTASITPPGYLVAENTTLVLHGTGLAIADTDAGIANVVVSLSVGEGNLTVSVGANTVVMAGSGTASVELTGEIAEIQAVLDGLNGATLVYDAIDAPVASTTFTLAIDDQGNTGFGGAMVAQDTASLDILAENDGPTATITPLSYAILENTTLALHATGLSVADPDAGTDPIRAVLSVDEGVLTIGAGSTDVAVSGSGTGSVTLDGTQARINNLLAGAGGATVAFDANDDSVGSAVLSLTVNDLGNNGAGSLMADTDIANIAITTENDGPVASISAGGYSVPTLSAFTLSGTGITVADPDAGAATVQATLAVGEGVLFAFPGATSVTVFGSGTGTVNLFGSIAQINGLLAGASGAVLTYTPAADPSSNTSLTLTIDDQGHGGDLGGFLSDSHGVTLDLPATAPAAAPDPTQPAPDPLPDPEPEPEPEPELEPEAEPEAEAELEPEPETTFNPDPVALGASVISGGAAGLEASTSVESTLAPTTVTGQEVALGTDLGALSDATPKVSVDLLRDLLTRPDSNELLLLEASGNARPVSVEEAQSFLRELDQMRDEVQAQGSVEQRLIASTLTASSGLSIGYVVWLLRGGVLLGSVLSSLPAWRLVDPLPVLGRMDEEDELDELEDDRGLDEMVDSDAVAALEDQ